MIRINLTFEQIEKINYTMDNDIDKDLWNSYNETVLKIVRDERLNQVNSLIGDKDKLRHNCKIFGRENLRKFSDQVKEALVNDITDKELRNLIKDKLYHAFEKLYKNFSKRICAYEILSIINATVCPYCNRMYTFTVKGKTRPEFDHFYSKKAHPWLAICVYNLIPSCSICNKGKSESDTENLLYPYEESFEEKNIRFQLKDVVSLLLDEKNINQQSLVKLNSEHNQYPEIIKKYNLCYKIEELYKEHKGYIVELIKRIYYYNNDCIESIYNSYDGIIDDIDELRQMSIGNVSSQEYLNTPLAKLTNDLIEQVLFE